MFLPGSVIADWSIIVQGQTWVLASIGAVVEMGVLSTLERLPMESRAMVAPSSFHFISQKVYYNSKTVHKMYLPVPLPELVD
jgi:hypothetical protein